MFILSEVLGKRRGKRKIIISKTKLNADESNLFIVVKSASFLMFIGSSLKMMAPW